MLVDVTNHLRNIFGESVLKKPKKQKSESMKSTTKNNNDKLIYSGGKS